MRITLNLATRPFTDLGPALRRLRIGMAILAVLCILFGIGLHLLDRRAEVTRARERTLDAQVGRVRAERESDEAIMRLPANAEVLEQAQALNQLFDQKAFSWTLAMEAMETVLPAGVQVTAIEPIRAKDGSITVHLRVLGPHDRSVDLVRNLEHSRRFLQPRIAGESAESSNTPLQRQEPVGPSNRFEFDLFADYNPPSPEERIALHSERNPATSGVPLGIRPPHPHHVPAAPGQNLPAVPDHGRQPYTGPSPSPSGGNPAYFHNPPPGGPQ